MQHPDKAASSRSVGTCGNYEVINSWTTTMLQQLQPQPLWLLLEPLCWQSVVCLATEETNCTKKKVISRNGAIGTGTGPAATNRASPSAVVPTSMQ